MRTIQALAVAATLTLSSNVASAQVTANVLHRVFLIKFEQSSGNAFTIDVDKKQYLVTAKHVVPRIEDNDEILLFHKGEWKKLSVKVIAIADKEVDVVVLIPPIQLSPALSMEPTTDGVIWSQQMFFLGFPYMMHTDVGDLNRGFPMPFIKGGILSAMDNRKDKGYSILYIDGLNNPGFSGGPVVFKDSNTKKLKVAGVVSSYRNHPEVVVNKNLNTGLTALSNSGILIAYDISTAVTAIKTRPEGPDIK